MHVRSRETLCEAVLLQTPTPDTQSMDEDIRSDIRHLVHQFGNSRVNVWQECQLTKAITLSAQRQIGKHFISSPLDSSSVL